MTDRIDVDAILASLPDLADPGEDPWGGDNLESSVGLDMDGIRTERTIKAVRR